MRICQFCGNKNIIDTITEYTYKHDGNYLIIDDVPCKQCKYCGERYFEAKVLKQIENEYNNIYSLGKRANREITVPVENFQEIASLH